MASLLLVDDEADILAAYRLIFLGEGHGVRCANNGIVALQHLEQDLPDLIITDWMMPMMGGAALCQKVRADPRFCHIPILVHSASPPREDGMQLWNECLQKPVHFDFFLAVIAKLCTTKI